MIFANPVIVCRIVTLFIGVSEVKVASNPVGSCPYCCKFNNNTDIKFNLFTRSNPSQSQLVVVGDLSRLGKSSFNQSDPVVIYLHGFSESANGASSKTIRDAYLGRGNYNVILTDWAPLVTFPWYVSAVRNTRKMGAVLASLIRFLTSAGVSAANIHIIGFSLGAEAAGFAGKELRREGVSVGRITGLDPAFPGYGFTDGTGHLTKGDALFVDVLHTNPGVFGFANPIGDVDFYPNFGSPIQPGCTPWELINIRQLDRLYGCSHNRAWRYYAESVRNPQGFQATICIRWTGVLPPCRFTVDGYMGFAASPPNKGKMYLKTNAISPYARNGP